MALQNELRLVTGDERSQRLVKLVVRRVPRVVEKLSLNSATSAYPAGSATSRRISRVTPSNSLTTSGASVGGPNRLSQIVRGSRPSAATATPRPTRYGSPPSGSGSPQTSTSGSKTSQPSRT